MSREGHKNADLRQERTAGPCFYMAFDRFGWNLQKQFGQVTGGECLLGEGAVIILQELSQFFHIKTPFLFEMNGGNETSEILGESLIIHPQHLSEFVPNVPFHESRPPISFVSCGFCFGIFVFPFDGLIIPPECEHRSSKNERNREKRINKL